MQAFHHFEVGKSELVLAVILKHIEHRSISDFITYCKDVWGGMMSL